MKRYQLSEFAEKFGQDRAASVFGVNQSAISKAIRTGRKITVIEDENGEFRGEEIRPFPHSNKLKRNVINQAS